MSEVQTKLMQSEDGGYYVFWESPSAYGSRGLGMDKHHAQAVADAIQSTGDPNAALTSALPPNQGPS